MGQLVNPFDIATSPDHWAMCESILNTYGESVTFIEPYNKQGYLSVNGFPNNSNKFKSDINDSGFVFIGKLTIPIQGSAIGDELILSMVGISDDNNIAYTVEHGLNGADYAFNDPEIVFDNVIVKNMTAFWDSLIIPIFFKTTGFRIKIS